MKYRVREPGESTKPVADVWVEQEGGDVDLCIQGPRGNIQIICSLTARGQLMLSYGLAHNLGLQLDEEGQIRIDHPS